MKQRKKSSVTFLVCAIVMLMAIPLRIAAQNTNDQVDSSMSMEEKLVALAIAHNADVEILNNNKTIAKYEVRKSSWNWINHITLAGNLNEFTIDNQSTQAAFYPRYNLSLTVPLGLIGTRSNEVKISKTEYRNADVEIRKKEEEIRKQVLTLYDNYLLFQNLIRIQNQKTEDEYAYFKSVEAKFTNQRVDIEVFKEASNKYNLELEKKYTLAYEQKVAKIALESLIGITMEEAQLR
jgi:outer membrane protein TolC